MPVLGALTPRTLGAGAGLLAAAATIGVILWQLLDAATPMPTTLFLQNLRDRAVEVQAVSLSTRPALVRTVSLPPASGSAAGIPGWEGGGVDLPPGRPVSVRLLALNDGRDEACELEARPRGRCQARIGLAAAGGLDCAWRCEAAAASAP